MHVLIVDDEALALENIRLKLMQIPMVKRIDAFKSPVEALEFLEENRVDVGFFDISMHEMDGISLAKRAKAIQPSLAVIFLTGHSEFALEAIQMHASGYLLKPAPLEKIKAELKHVRGLESRPDEKKTASFGAKERVRVQTFGNFEIFVDNTPLVFRRYRSKEILAYLVDRKGAAIQRAELASILWEDRQYGRSEQYQLQSLIASLMETLQVAGVSDILVRGRNSLAIDTAKIDCDYYRLLEGDVQAAHKYTGEYMSNYSWAEYTLANIEKSRNRVD